MKPRNYVILVLGLANAIAAVLTVRSATLPLSITLLIAGVALLCWSIFGLRQSKPANGHAQQK